MLAGTVEGLPDFYLYDDDRIEDTNLITSPYMSHQLGVLKVNALAEMLYRKNVHARVCSATIQSRDDMMGSAVTKRQVVVDTFDNREARLCTRPGGHRYESRILTLHAGVSAQQTGSVEWDQHWTPPPVSEFGRGDNPVCTHMLGASILQLTAVHAALALRTLLVDNRLINYPMITLEGREN